MALLLPEYPVIGTSAGENPSIKPSPISPITRRSTINRVSRSATERNLSVAGAGAYVPVVYGNARLGPLVAQTVTYQNDLVMCLVWCVGEIEAIDGLYMQDGSAAPASVTATHYTGTTTQSADPTLSAAIPGWTKTLVESINGETVGLAYSVVRIAQSRDFDIPAFVAEVRGLKLYDPREVAHDPDDKSTWEYSDNPALCLANLETSSLYGRARSFDWTSVESVADDCDEVVAATEARRTLGLAITSRSSVDDVIDTMSVYAGCYVAPEGSTTRLISNRPASSVAAITHDDIMTASDGAPDLSISLRSSRDVPTVVCVTYTDTTTDVWRDGKAYAYASGVLAGTTEWRESTVHLPGVTRYTQAYREAVERLNMLALTDLDVSFVTRDTGLKYQVGDVITVTSDRGLAAKPVRITSISPVSAGRWRVSGHEYQSAVYSDDIETEPTYTDTDLPSPLDPPAPTGLVLTEEVYQGQNGIYQSRISATWTDTPYVYLANWEVQVFDGADQVAQGLTSVNEYASPAVNDLVEYTVKVRSVSSVGAASAWTEDTITASGKFLVPGDVPGIDAYEVGGITYAKWTAATDVDIWRYEVRYSAVGAGWAAGLVVDRIDGLRMSTQDIPAGTWDIMVKAVDSIGQYSTNAATATYTVTSDSGAYVVDEYDFDTPSLTNMTAYKLWRGDALTHYVTDMGDTAASQFTGDLTTYTEVAAVYHSSGGSELLTESFDIGTETTGTWAAHADRMALSGTATAYLELSTDEVDWDQYEFLTTKKAARYARIRAESSGTSTLYGTIPQYSVNVNVVPRVETGSDTSSASGAVTVSTTGIYTAVQAINITPLGTTALSAVVDNITILSTHVEFDVYIYNTSDVLVSTNFLWEFRGI